MKNHLKVQTYIANSFLISFLSFSCDLTNFKDKHFLLLLLPTDASSWVKSSCCLSDSSLSLQPWHRTETYRVEVTLSRRGIGFSSIAERRRYCWGGEMRVGSVSWIDGFASAAVPGVCALSLSITVPAARLSLSAFSFFWPSPHPLLLSVFTTLRKWISEWSCGSSLQDATMAKCVYDDTTQ